MDWWLWLVVAAALAAAEIHTQAFYALFLALGAIAAALVSGIGGPLSVQAIIGAAAAIAGLIAVRPAVKRLAEERRSAPYRFPGMAGSLIGLRAVTVDMVGDEHHPGHALLAKERWLAVTDSPEPIPSDTEVVVAAVRGTTLLVRAAMARLP